VHVADIGAALIALGVTDAEVEQATADGTLLALLVERFLLGTNRYDPAEAAAKAGVSIEAAARLWRALGFPQVADGRRQFTDNDVDVFRTVVGEGSTLSDAFYHEARLLSEALARVAEVLVDEMWDAYIGDGTADAAISDVVEAGIDIPRIERILLHILRRQLVASVYRRATLHRPPGQAAGPFVAVGFADLVGFTALSQRVGVTELARLVMRFEEATYDLVADAGGRVIKTIGDEAMFTFPAPLAAARLAIRLATTLPAELPSVRISIAWGPVLIREGDCFGPTVSLASRIVGAASPGQVLVSEATRDALARDPSVEVRSIPAVELKDFGSVPLWELTGAG
jgi:adenylate cyclase